MAIRTDDTGFKGYKLLQDTDAFCYGVDAVLLADYSRAEETEHVLDLGSGNGAVPIVLMGKFNPASVTGVEVQPTMAELASKSAELNGLSDRVKFICGDVKDIRNLVEGGSFDVVTCNPPYFESGRGPASSASAAFVARHETTAKLMDFVSAAAYALRRGGRFVLVHRPSRLPDIFECCRKCGLEPKKLRMVAPKDGESANIVLVSCVKGGGKELKIDPQLSVHTQDGGYTEEIERIYERI